MQKAPLVQITIQRGAHSMVRYQDPRTKALQDRLSVLRIEDIWKKREWDRGVYLFTSLDGMNEAQLRAASWLWEKLSDRPDSFACLNKPRKVLGRFQLLKKLFTVGINDFNVHLVDELPNDIKFPVFVRYEFLHRANLTELLHSRTELEDVIALLLMKGERAEDLIVVEHLDYRDEDGLYRKYGAQIVDDKILGRHVFVGKQWMIKQKYSDAKLMNEKDREFAYGFPHQDLLEPVFDISGHDWGRVDYSFYKGRLQIWEINDNPEMGAKWKRRISRNASRSHFYQQLATEFDNVSRHLQPGASVKFELPSSRVLEQERVLLTRKDA